MAAKKSTKGRARRAARAIFGGWKGTAFEGATGGVGYHLQMAVAGKSETVRDKWWVGPVGMVAVGHFIKRKPRLAGVGAALIGAGGYAFELNRALSKQGGSNAEPAAAPAEAGSVIAGSRPGMLPAGNVVPFPSESATSDASPEAAAVMSLGRGRRYR
jgi:hypothetical protein